MELSSDSPAGALGRVASRRPKASARAPIEERLRPSLVRDERCSGAARTSQRISLFAGVAIFALAFLFLSVAPIYMVWLTPDFFNLAIVLIAYFFWSYKEVAAAPPADSRTFRGSWTTGTRSDLVAAVLLGIATFSKPTHILLMGPILALFAVRRQWLRAVVSGSVFALVTAALFAWNIAISGEWKYQGGEERATF